MASAALSPAPRVDAERPSLVADVAKRVVNALVSSRAAAAERELRRRRAYLNETALVTGEYRTISLNKADLLPFNV